MTDLTHNELAVRRLEQRRSDAMEQGDVATLEEVLAPDFQLVHGDGTLDDRRGAVEAALRMPRRVIVPRELTIRLLGDTALLTGPMTLAVTIGDREKVVRIFMSQLARLDGERWQFIWSQVTLMAD